MPRFYFCTGCETGTPAINKAPPQRRCGVARHRRHACPNPEDANTLDRLYYVDRMEADMAKTELGAALAALGALGIPQRRVARLFGVGGRSARRWSDGTRRVPCAVAIVIDLLADGGGVDR